MVTRNELYGTKEEQEQKQSTFIGCAYCTLVIMLITVIACCVFVNNSVKGKLSELSNEVIVLEQTVQKLQSPQTLLDSCNVLVQKEIEERDKIQKRICEELEKNCLLDEKLKKAENNLSELTKENSSLKESSIATTLRMEYLEKSLEFYVKAETKYITELIGMMKTDDMRAELNTENVEKRLTVLKEESKLLG